jgi:hypothetical protein
MAIIRTAPIIAIIVGIVGIIGIVTIIRIIGIRSCPPRAVSVVRICIPIGTEAEA